MKQFIYADNAATTRLDENAFEAMKPYLLAEYGNASQPYSFSRTAKKALNESRKNIAECIGATPEEIYFTSGGTESDNWAIKSSVLTEANRREIITSQIEHHAILRACEVAEQLGCRVQYLPVDSEGVVSSYALSDCISGDTRLVSVMMANNEIGTIQDIAALVEIAHAHGALFHTDAVQAVGHIPIDVRELGVDMLSASAHKFNGPKGIGFLYVKTGTPLPSYMSGGAQESGMRAGTENVASIVGMATALRNNVEAMEKTAEHLFELENRLLCLLRERQIPFTRNGSEKHIPGNISLSFDGKDGEALLHRLDLMGIYVSTGAACNSEDTQVSHVLQAIALPERLAKGTIRVSLGKDNTAEDVEKIAVA